MEFCVKTGAFVGVSFLSNPGIKNVAGETVAPVLMPEQPAPEKANAVANIANNRKLQFNLTCTV